ncbi:MAG TPA: protein translocase subunit SecF [Candidatus Polarisedimenticolaceae bacterium]|nr:protein translocase subunit SecF [Candidatus Polarisedimenticolaceae bacterium]
MFQIFKDSKFDFMRLRRFWVAFSFAMLILSVVAVATKGIRWGIEFEGGAQVQVKYPQKPDVATIRQELARAGYNEAVVTTIGKPGDNEIYVRVPLREGAKDNDVAAQVVRTLQAASGGQQLTVSSQSYIGPTVGRELIQKAVWAVVGAIGGMLVYIWFRFEFQWGLAAIIAMIHDAMITLGLFVLFGYEMSLPVIAAFLTLIGYSVNDTVVIFDRIRENRQARGGVVGSLPQLINDSVNQTLSRTILTSFLTWLSCVSIFLFGGPALRDFSFVLVVGIVIGTYSTIYIASPILVVWQDWVIKRKQAAASVAPAAASPKATAKKVRAGKA